MHACARPYRRLCGTGVSDHDAWVRDRPGVTAPIVGATKVGHVEDALAAEALELTPEEIARVEEPYMPHAVSGHE